jgi:two-component system LytT family response regulator
MDSISAYIIDDESQSRSLLRKLLGDYFPDIRIVGEASTISEGLTGIQEHHPEIVFLDIQISDETGFELLNRLPKIDFALIFITAYSQYALKAFRFNAIDYLLKPIVAEELIEAVNKVKQRITPRTDSKDRVNQLYKDLQEPQKVHDKIAVPTLDGFVIIPLKDIIYCHASNNYTKFYLTDKKCILSSYTLKHYSEILSSKSFFRVHRSYIINVAHVKMYRKGEGGQIVMSNGDEIELSRTHKMEFLHLLNIR